jgi:potassium-transporting ATPase potassium-binding subunit
MHDSFTPLGGMIPLINIMLGEVVFGGVGSGLYGIIVFMILAVFIAGIDGGPHAGISGQENRGLRREDGHAHGADFLRCSILGFTGISVANKFGTCRALANPGPHGLSEIFYAYTSSRANNGSAFAGLNANTLWYNVSLAFRHAVGPLFHGHSRSWPSPEAWRARSTCLNRRERFR